MTVAVIVTRKILIATRVKVLETVAVKGWVTLRTKTGASVDVRGLIAPALLTMLVTTADVAVSAFVNRLEAATVAASVTVARNILPDRRVNTADPVVVAVNA